MDADKESLLALNTELREGLELYMDAYRSLIEKIYSGTSNSDWSDDDWHRFQDVLARAKARVG